VQSVDSLDEPVLRRLANVAKLQEKDSTELGMQLVSGRRRPRQISFSAKGVATLRAINTAELTIESVMLYGKLQKLSDFREADEGDHFWGRIREDNGKVWRVRFAMQDLASVQKLFTKQVAVSGTAAYFKTRSPRIEVSTIQAEKPRDYLAALKHMQTQYSKFFAGRTSEAILGDVRD
jgi:hypothetical protein